MGIEQEASHILQVGYLKGAQNFGLNYLFEVRAQVPRDLGGITILTVAEILLLF